MIYADALLTLGILFLAGLVADQIGRRTPFPRVTLLLICGVAAGAAGLVPERVSALTDTVMVTALTLVAFLLGGSFKWARIKAHGAEIVVISISIVVTTLILVTLGLLALGFPLPLALVLAGIATATDPAATLDVLRQTRSAGRFGDIIKGIVAIDDAWGLLAFSICLAVATQLAGNGAAGVLPALWHVGGAILLGGAIGVPAAFLTGRISEGEPLQIEALSIAFLTAGIAVFLEVSFLIAGMVVGGIIANLARHHSRAFHEIEHIEWPFMIVFFILAGAALDLGALEGLGLLGAAYVILRTVARISGGWFGASLVRAPAREKRLYGIALLPQAGVAIGMALIAAQTLPQWHDRIIALAIGSTVLFELAGPVATLWALRKSAQIKAFAHNSDTAACTKPPSDAPRR